MVVLVMLGVAAAMTVVLMVSRAKRLSVPKPAVDPNALVGVGPNLAIDPPAHPITQGERVIIPIACIMMGALGSFILASMDRS